LVDLLEDLSISANNLESDVKLLTHNSRHTNSDLLRPP